MSTLLEFENKFKTKELKLFQTDYWVWSLRPHQATLGAGVLSLKRECATLGELTPEEYCDLNNIIRVMEHSLKFSFNYDILNYLMLMMIDRQVHYHVIPRYENELEKFGRVWVDEKWPGVPNLAGENLNMDKLIEISNYIKSNLKV
ncbi:HIT family protein [Bacillus sp. Marseille-P3661]|uniref:HIT family protein n=1 Tax=Bacillus sp. Marseille-P3661 TaxID=1936234 RepID=UPI000C85ECD3|nr:HIT family protein [Bacillus sp. Marseille-P3661]